MTWKHFLCLGGIAWATGCGLGGSAAQTENELENSTNALHRRRDAGPAGDGGWGVDGGAPEDGGAADGGDVQDGGFPDDAGVTDGGDVQDGGGPDDAGFFEDAG